MNVNVNFVNAVLDAIDHVSNEYREGWEDLTNGILNHLFHDKDEITAWEMNDYLTTEFDSETLQEAMNYLGLGFGY